MAKIYDFFTERKKKKLDGKDFSPQDIFNFINHLGLNVGVEWCKNNSCNISIFYPKAGQMKEEVACFDLNDWNPSCNRLIINVYKKRLDINPHIVELRFRVSMEFLIKVSPKEKKKPE